MAQQNFVNLAFTGAQINAAPTAISATVTETVMFPSLLVPANTLYTPEVIRITAHGVYTSAASAQGTLTFKVHMGTANSNADLVVAGSPAITVPASGSNTGWIFSFLLQVWQLGASGNTVIGTGMTDVATVTTGSDIVYHLHGVAGATVPAAVAVNTTVANSIGCYATFSSATTNTLQTFAYTYETLN